MLLIFLLPIPIGFMIGLILCYAERSDALQSYASAETECVAVSDVRNGDLRGLEDTIIDIYVRHGFKLESRTEHQLIFEYPIFLDRIMGAIVWHIFLTIGGVLGLLMAFYFFGIKGDNVEVNLISEQ